MRHLRLLSTMGLTSIFLLTSTALADPPPVPIPVKPGEAVAQPAFRAKQVIGTKVSILNNVSVGTVDDIVFDEMGQIEYLVVIQDDKYVTIPWEAAKFNYEKRTALLNIAQDKYMVMPTYTLQQYPNYYAPAYRTTTYRYFGLTPRERRIIERRP